MTQAIPGPNSRADTQPLPSRATDGPRACETIDRVLARAGVPDRFRDCSFESFAERDGTRRARAVAEETARNRRSLLLIGKPGTGKTHLAAALLRQRAVHWLASYPTQYWVNDGGEMFVRPPFGGRFVVVPTLLDHLRFALGYHDGDQLPGLMKISTLVLDDLGAERSTEWVIERLYVLVNDRYNHRLQTIVTTNFGLNELADRGYQRMISRLSEDADLVELSGADYRRRRA